MSLQVSDNQAGTSAPRITVLIANDQPLFREALRCLLETDSGLEIVGEACNGQEAVQMAKALRPDVVLLDLIGPPLAGLDAVREVAAASSSHVLLLTANTHNNEVLEALTLGARGVVPKRSATDLLFKSIRTVHAGNHWIGRACVDEVIDRMRQRASWGAPAKRPTFGLSSRELQVVSTIVAGYTNEDIAGELHLSVKTVKHHLTSIFDKLGISNRLELALFAVQHHLASAPDSSTDDTRRTLVA